MCKCSCHQTWQLECHPQTPHAGRRKPTPESCSLNSTYIHTKLKNHVILGKKSKESMVMGWSHSHLVNSQAYLMPRFHTQHYVNRVWPCRPVVPALRRWGAGRSEVQSHLWLHSNFEIGLGYKRPQLKQNKARG